MKHPRTLSALLTLILLAAGTAGAQTVIQKATFSQQPSSSGTVTLTLPQSTSAGHALIVGLSFWPLDISSVSDNSGDTFTRGLTTSIYHNVSQGKMYTNFFYATAIAGGATTITLNFSGGSTYVVVAFAEVSNISTSSPVAQSAYNESLTSTSPWTSASITASANQYLFSWAADEWYGTPCSNPSSGWVLESQISQSIAVCLLDTTTSSAGSYQASVTPGTAFNYAMEIVAFNVATPVTQKATFSQQPSSSGTVTLTLPQSTAAGHALIVGMNFWPQDITSVSDNSGDTFTRGLGTSIYHNVSQGPMYTNFYYAKSTAGGATTITLNFSGGSTYVLVAFAEVAGLDPSAPLDQDAYNESLTATSPWSSASVTTTSANEYLFSWAASEWSGVSCSNPNAGWTIESQINDPAGATICLSDRTVSTTGAYQASVTPGTALNYAMEILTFKITGSGGGCSSAPPAPTGLTATPGNAQVSLSWNASSCATSYNIYRSQTSGTEAAPAIASPSGTSYTDTGVTNNLSYYYVVTAVNSYGESAHSNEAGPVTPTAGLLSITSCGTVGQGGNDQPVFQSCLDQATNAGQTLDVPAGTYNLAPCTSNCGSGQGSNRPWAIHFPANGNMKLESGVTINASGTYSCSSSPMAMFEMEENGLTLSGAGASNSVISMQSQGFCEPHEILRIAGQDKASGNVASNITISGITAKYGSGDNLYITYADSVSVTNSVFDHGQRNSASLTDMVTNITFNNDTFQYAFGDPCAGSHCPNAGLDIEPNTGVSNNKVQSILIKNSTFTHNGSQTTSPTNYTNFGDGIQIQLWHLADAGEGNAPVSITITGATSSFNNRYGFVALNADGGNPSGTVEIDQSSSTNDGFQCAAGLRWQTGGESFVINGLTCTNPHHNRTSPDGTYGTYGSGSAVASLRGGGSNTALGAIHFENTNISITDSNTQYYFEFLDFSNKGFGTDTDFYPLGTMSGATSLPNGKNGYFQPLNTGTESQTCNYVQAGVCH